MAQTSKQSLVQHLCVLLMIEGLAGIGLSLFLFRRGMPLVFTPLVVAGLVAALQLLSVAGLFAIAHAWRMKRSAEQQIGVGATLRLIAAETVAYLRLYLGYHLFEPLLGIREPREIIEGRRPVVFVHGFMCNGGYFLPLVRALEARGVGNLFTINCAPPFGSIDKFAEQLEARVEEVLSLCKADKVILVGHSMGGLTSRSYVTKRGGAGKVAKIITLGTPHHGTAHAYFSKARDAKQMRPGNPWLRALEALEASGVPLTSIYSYHDDVIAPQDSSHVPWAKNVAFKGIGHLEMSFSAPIQRAVHDEIVEALDA